MIQLSDKAVVSVVLAILAMAILFAGEPDITDGIIYRLFDGNVPVMEQGK